MPIIVNNDFRICIATSTFSSITSPEACTLVLRLTSNGIRSWLAIGLIARER